MNGFMLQRFFNFIDKNIIFLIESFFLKNKLKKTRPPRSKSVYLDEWNRKNFYFTRSFKHNDVDNDHYMMIIPNLAF